MAYYCEHGTRNPNEIGCPWCDAEDPETIMDLQDEVTSLRTQFETSFMLLEDEVISLRELFKKRTQRVEKLEALKG